MPQHLRSVEVGKGLEEYSYFSTSAISGTDKRTNLRTHLVRVAIEENEIFQKFLENFVLCISGTIIKVLPPVSRRFPKSFNKADSSDELTTVELF